MNRKTYIRDCLLGALGAFFMLIGDLCLSVIPASPGDSGLFLREAYLDGSYAAWRLPLLIVTGLAGMALCSFAVRACYEEILPACRKTRALVKIGGVIYLTSAGVLHLFIGSLADWTARLSPLLGREETAALIAEQYDRLIPAFFLAYFGMILLILVSAFARVSGRTFLPRRAVAFHMIVWQIVFVVIPDLRMAFGAVPATMDFVLSQGSGNAALCLSMLLSALWAIRKKNETEICHE